MSGKRKHLSLQEKRVIIEEWQKNEGKSKVELAKQFNLPESTLKGIIASRESILQASEKCGASSSKRQKVLNNKTEAFENSLIQWFHEARAANIPISGAALKEKALQLALVCGMENFKASCGWLYRFKERHGLSHKSICGESAAVNQETVDDWKESLDSITEGFEKKKTFLMQMN